MNVFCQVDVKSNSEFSFSSVHSVIGQENLRHPCNQSNAK